MKKATVHIRLSLLYASVFISFGVFAPFFPVWLASRDFSAEQIGSLMAVPNLLRMALLAPLMHWADRYRRLAPLIALAAFMSAGLLAALAGITSWGLMLAGMALWAFFWNPVLPLTEAFALSQVQRAGLDFGRVRLWGSLAFMLSSSMAGVLIGWSGAHAILWIIAAMLLLPGLLWPWLTTLEKQHNALSLATSSTTMSDAQQQGYKPLRDRPLLLVLASVALIQSSHAVYYVFSAEHWLANGLASGWIGALWSLGVVAEVILFWLARRWIIRLGALPFIALGALGASVRWLIMSLDPTLLGLIPLQILHALSFGAPYLGLMAFIATRVPGSAGAHVQGLSAALQAGVMAATTAGAGVLWDAFGVGAYAPMATLSLLAIGVIAAAHLQPSRP
jgi:MFS transporter, PPP family, 3-phenylpropionic acid transporter